MNKTERLAIDGLDAAILEMANDARSTGAMSDEAFGKITMRQIGREPDVSAPTLTGADIRTIRERARMSQAVFARHLQLTPSYVSQLERGAKQPSGPALVLLDIIRRHGMGLIVTGAE